METATSLSSYARDFEHELARWKSLRKTEGILVPEVLVYMMDDYSGQDGLLELSTLREEYRFKAEYLRERCAKVVSDFETSGAAPTATKDLGHVALFAAADCARSQACHVDYPR